jgi:hypothetical protein
MPRTGDRRQRFFQGNDGKPYGPPETPDLTRYTKNADLTREKNPGVDGTNGDWKLAEVDDCRTVNMLGKFMQRMIRPSREMINRDDDWSARLELISVSLR